MQTNVTVSLNGRALHAIDGRIILQGVEEQAPNLNITAQSRASLYGQYYTGTEKRYRDIIVRFAICVTRNLAERERILQSVAEWAQGGGALELSYRTGMKINVICAALPAVVNIDQWTTAYQVTFRAYVPEWQDNAAVSVVDTDTGGTADLLVTANGGGKLEVEAANASGTTCSTITITANGQSFIFTSLGLASGSSLKITYDTDDVQSIRIGTASAMAKRTAASSDEIILKKGHNEITYSADVSLTWTFSCRGRWIG